MALPMPLPPPVMIATFPDNRTVRFYAKVVLVKLLAAGGSLLLLIAACDARPGHATLFWVQVERSSFQIGHFIPLLPLRIRSRRKTLCLARYS
jgi:hypothetical protein